MLFRGCPKRTKHVKQSSGARSQEGVAVCADVCRTVRKRIEICFNLTAGVKAIMKKGLQAS